MEKNQQERSMLFLGVRLDELDPKVRIYGTPDGLRYLGNLLIQLANDPQSDLNEQEKSIFVQLKKSGFESPLIDESLNATIGRMDHKTDGSVDGFLRTLSSPNGEHELFKRIILTCLD